MDVSEKVDSYWVSDGQLMAGEYPGAVNNDEALGKLSALLASGVTCFIDLTQAGERTYSGSLVPYAPVLETISEKGGPNAEYHRFPIADQTAPSRQDMVRILDLIDANIADGRTVYVHCWGGVGRTGAVVGCYLNRHGYSSGIEAIQKIGQLREFTKKANRPSPETTDQEEIIATWSSGE